MSKPFHLILIVNGDFSKGEKKEALDTYLKNTPNDVLLSVTFATGSNTYYHSVSCKVSSLSSRSQVSLDASKCRYERSDPSAYVYKVMEDCVDMVQWLIRLKAETKIYVLDASSSTRGLDQQKFLPILEKIENVNRFLPGACKLGIYACSARYDSLTLSQDKTFKIHSNNTEDLKIALSLPYHRPAIQFQEKLQIQAAPKKNQNKAGQQGSNAGAKLRGGKALTRPGKKGVLCDNEGRCTVVNCPRAHKACSFRQNCNNTSCAFGH